MEKSSEKLIRDVSPKRNPFNDMLSEVHLKLSTPEAKKKKPKNIALEYDPFVDKDSCQDSLIENREATPKFKFPQRPQASKGLADVAIKTPLQTKNSSDTVPAKEIKSREELIGQWIAEYMHKKSLMGPHWQYKFKRRQFQLVQEAFMAIKYSNLQPNYTFNDFSKFYESKKAEILVNAVDRCRQTKIKDSFQTLLTFYKDQILFGLSQTLGEGNDNKGTEEHSQLLKLDSDCKASEKLFKKETGKTSKQRKNSCGDISIESHSHRLISQKGSQPSEDLSALILNHNKLHLSGSLNTIKQSQPNIPKSKNSSSRNLASNRDLGELSLSTNNKINSNRKLDSLPLDSSRNLVEIKFDKLKAEDSLVDRIDENSSKNQSTPPNITVTYILKNIDLQHFNEIANQNTRELEQEKPTTPDYINRVPIAESFYQPAQKHPPQIVNPSPAPPRNVFTQLVEQSRHPQGKKSVSLQIKPQPRCISPEPGRRDHELHRFANNNEYYPEDNTRRDSFRANQQGGYFPFEKPRAHSATPKIRFTFTSNPPSPLPSSSGPQRHAPPSINQHQNNMGYDNADCIKQNSIIKNGGSRQGSNMFGSEGSKNSLPQNSKMSRSKITQQREHIKDLILPAAYDEYYTHNNHRKPSPQQRPSLKGPFLSGSNTSTSPYSNVRDRQINTNTNQFGIVMPRKHNHRVDDEKWQGRAKSPKEKILVTCSSKGRI